MYNLGYACINMGLSNQPKSKRVTTNRSMIRRTFLDKGLPYASELALQNCLDLEKIIEQETVCQKKLNILKKNP